VENPDRWLEAICPLQVMMLQSQVKQIMLDQVENPDRWLEAICPLQVMMLQSQVKQITLDQAENPDRWPGEICLLQVMMLQSQVKLITLDQADQIHYLVKADQLVDLLREIQADPLRVNTTHHTQTQLVTIWGLRQTVVVTMPQPWLQVQTTWLTCNLIWTMQEHIKVQKDLLQEILDQCQAICRQICLRHQTTQMTVVR